MFLNSSIILSFQLSTLMLSVIILLQLQLSAKFVSFLKLLKFYKFMCQNLLIINELASYFIYEIQLLKIDCLWNLNYYSEFKSLSFLQYEIFSIYIKYYDIAKCVISINDYLILIIDLSKRIMSKGIILLLALTICATSLLTNLDSQYVPVSKRYPGLVIGTDNTPVTVQLVYDPTCESTAEFDQVIRQVILNLGNNLSKVTFKYAINALPYHISSFKLAQAIKFVYDHNGSALALTTFRQFLDNIQKWDEKAILKISLNDHMNNIARKVAEITNISYDVIRPEIAHFSVTDNQTRKWTKYVMGSLRIPGTPFIFVNGARLDGGTGMTADQLTDFIVKLL